MWFRTRLQVHHRDKSDDSIAHHYSVDVAGAAIDVAVVVVADIVAVVADAEVLVSPVVFCFGCHSTCWVAPTETRLHVASENKPLRLYRRFRIASSTLSASLTTES